GNAISTTKKKQDAATVVGNVSHQSHNVDVDDFWVGSSEHANPAKKSLSALPSARLLAQRLGVDLQRLQGTGPDGLIVDSDVQNAA
ncbi:2-oxo acid dehydrogenase subunit E2, partial [Vibrio fluvialis]|nr:2-oxo acid dehydrogenase subunit E2 [Vibrio fluvialis]